LNLDDSVTVACSITKGDLPVNIWWEFEEDNSEFRYNLTTNDGVLISRTTQKVSMLSIDAVKARHRGRYTCFASNKGGFNQQTSYLALNGLITVSYYINR
jgi:Immunoglobulin domain